LPIRRNLSPDSHLYLLSNYIAAVAVRPRDPAGVAVRAAASCEAEGPYSDKDQASSVVDIPETVLSLPANEHALVERFLRDYSVTCRDCATPSLPPIHPTPRWPYDNNSRARPAGPALPPNRPRWMLLLNLGVSD
jgi:hypothetical protein